MTKMADEIASIPDVVAEQIDAGMATYAEVGRQLAVLDPACVVTCARGSSDHAALYFKYLVEIGTGIPVASVGPSMTSVYGSAIRSRGVPVFAVSQSGGSPDTTAFVAAARAAGAPTFALVNTPGSSLAAAAGQAIALHAGTERAIAATKSFVCSLVALAAIVAAWRGDAALTDAIRDLPARLSAAVGADWPSARDAFAGQRNAFVLSRGPTLAIAAEAALKLKETCLLHAEAFSAAELRHGPFALAEAGLCALAFLPRDAGAASVLECTERLRATGVNVLVAGAGPEMLPTPITGHPMLDPIAQITAFYGFVEQLSLKRGHDPDGPRNLAKVTQTM